MKTEATKSQFKKKVMENGEDKIDEHLATTQKAIEAVAGKVAHNTKSERPDSVRIREEAVARCTKKIKRRVSRNKPEKPGQNTC